jgi:diadenosine tetraphosphate (Ap4A) HIT family hydrolase
MELLYEDESVKVEMPDKPAAKGHLQVSTVQELKSLTDAGDEVVEHLFFTSSYAATALFELLQAQGTNIILNDLGNGVCVDVIARDMEDGLGLMWEPKKADPAELDEVASKIKGKTDYIGVAKVEKKPVDLDKKTSMKDDGEVNYLIRSLRRIP